MRAGSPRLQAETDSKLKSENAELKGIVNQMRADMESLMSKGTNPVDLESEITKRRLVESDLKILSKQLEDAQSENEKLNSQLISHNNNTEKFMMSFQKQTKYIKNVKEERDRLLKVSSELRAQLNFAQKQSKTYSDGFMEDRFDPLMTPQKVSREIDFDLIGKVETQDQGI